MKERDRRPGELIFHPLNGEEYNIPMQFGNHFPQQLGTRPVFKDFNCGACGSITSGRVICDLIRKSDQAMVSWCVCSCDKREPTIFVEKDGSVISQQPVNRSFHIKPDWPTDLAALYEEAAKAFAASAHTAAVMVCRKLLMACACHEDGGAKLKDGEPFTTYVDYIVTEAIPFPKAKASIDAIRTIGNEATHKLTFVNPADSERAMRIVTYMLDTLYTLPKA